MAISENFPDFLPTEPHENSNFSSYVEAQQNELDELSTELDNAILRWYIEKTPWPQYNQNSDERVITATRRKLTLSPGGVLTEEYVKNSVLRNDERVKQRAEFLQETVLNIGEVRLRFDTGEVRDFSDDFEAVDGRVRYNPGVGGETLHFDTEHSGEVVQEIDKLEYNVCPDTLNTKLGDRIQRNGLNYEALSSSGRSSLTRLPCPRTTIEEEWDSDKETFVENPTHRWDKEDWERLIWDKSLIQTEENIAASSSDEELTEGSELTQDHLDTTPDFLNRFVLEIEQLVLEVDGVGNVDFTDEFTGNLDGNVEYTGDRTLTFNNSGDDILGIFSIRYTFIEDDLREGGYPKGVDVTLDRVSYRSMSQGVGIRPGSITEEWQSGEEYEAFDTVVHKGVEYIATETTISEPDQTKQQPWRPLWKRLWLYFDNENLDRIGRIFGSVGRRRQRDDRQYRQWLKSIVQLFSGSGRNRDIINAVAVAFSMRAGGEDNVSIEENFEDNEIEVILEENRWEEHRATTLEEIVDEARPSGVKHVKTRYNIPLQTLSVVDVVAQDADVELEKDATLAIDSVINNITILEPEPTSTSADKQTSDVLVRLFSDIEDSSIWDTSEWDNVDWDSITGTRPMVAKALSEEHVTTDKVDDETSESSEDVLTSATDSPTPRSTSQVVPTVPETTDSTVEVGKILELNEEYVKDDSTQASMQSFDEAVTEITNASWDTGNWDTSQFV